MPGILSDLATLLLGLPRTVSSQAPSYRQEDFLRLAGMRDCPVVVRGNPFAARGCDDTRFAAAVVAAMRGQAPGPDARFTLAAADDARGDHRVVVAFNAALTVGAADLCGGAGAIAADPIGTDGRVRVLAAWCRNGAVASECSGWTGGVQAPTDRRFTRLLAQVTRELFPGIAEPGGLKGH